MSASPRDAPPESDSLAAIDALSPLDGRYRAATAPLRGLLSEGALIRERIGIEARWLLHLAAAAPQLPGAHLSAAVRERAQHLAEAPDAGAAAAVKVIEARINHDVKAVEYYVREQLTAAGAGAATLELVHFGCTSEDINNLSYACLLKAARGELLTVLGQRISELTGLAHRYADTAMLARTHGQAASPTTLGKEIGNFAARLARAQQRLSAVPILGKWNGAVGNFNALVAAVPALDWPAVSAAFVTSLSLEYNPFTTQIEPHDWIAEYCDALAATNIIFIDLCRDFWGYISLGYLRQRAVAGEVGSSTMPHKINPIDFENAEGNLGVANALLRHFADKLPLSRWQRDLTDSTVLRNVGVALGHTLIAWTALARGLTRVEADASRMQADLAGAWEVLGEAVQTVLRAAGVAGGYERLKDFTRGRAIDAATLAQFIDSLPLTAADKTRLKAMRPQDYLGLAAQLARRV
jgi:adenylosuccinate lyase